MRSWQFWLGPVFSLEYLALALQVINIEEVDATLERVDGCWVFALLSVPAIFAVKEVGWKLLFRDECLRSYRHFHLIDWYFAQYLCLYLFRQIGTCLFDE